jgi:DNA-binding phage protein
MASTRAFEDVLLEDLRDPDFAAEYLKQVLAGGDRQEIERALRYIAEAQGIGVPVPGAA